MVPVVSVSVYWGAVYTAIIAALYLPGAFALRRRAERILEDLPPERRPPDAAQWLREHGLVVSLREQLPQVATILGSLLAGSGT